jgi:B12 binding domain
MILFFNPLSTTPGKQPLPLSVLSLAAVLEGRESWSLVDGNLVADPAADIIARLSAVDPRELSLLAVSVMPGPQLSQAVPVCKAVRAVRPDVPIVWGGYFPTQHSDTVLQSSFVDFVVRSQGEQPLRHLIEALRSQRPFETVGSLSWKSCPTYPTPACRCGSTSIPPIWADERLPTARRSAVPSPAASAQSSR